MLNAPRVRALCDRAGTALLRLSRLVPPRIHTANIRLHFNMMCNNERTIDRLEHLFYCEGAKGIFPSHWKACGERIARCFFLHHDSENDLILGAILIYGLYAYHCYTRHGPSAPDAKEAIFRIISTDGLHGRAASIWRRYMYTAS